MLDETNKKWAHVKARRLVWLAENGPCAKCGSTDRLEVDHVDPSQKIASSFWSWTETRRQAELVKCQVLCHNCHKEKTRLEHTRPNCPHCGSLKVQKSGRLRCLHCQALRRTRPRQSEICTVDSCGKPTSARNMCSMHYTRVLRHGDPYVVLRAGAKRKQP